MPSVTSCEVIINSGSGATDKEDVRRQLTEIFAAKGLDARILLGQSGAEIIELARGAVQGDSQVIVAAGGDGTVNAVASALVKTNKTLGILPLGTLNHFAKDLQIPLDLEGATHTIVAGQTTNVDIGEVNGRIFLNNSSLGLYPSIVREREKQQLRGSGKWLAFVRAVLTVLRRYPFINVRLNVEGKEFATRTPFVFIGNNEYVMESFKVGGRRCLNAGELSLYIMHRTGRMGLLRLAVRALFGGLSQEQDLISLCTDEVRIEARHKHLRVAMDGEVIRMEPPLHYRVRPGRLRVLVPRGVG
jgi:YegS/Rv2252/BmrU family lipid kinase